MPNKETLEELISQGLTFTDNYNLNDSIESDEDLALLFNVLLTHKDSKGNHPCITANCLMANPNFKQISKSNYNQYSFELVSDTFSEYNNSDTLKKYWLEGNSKNIFSLQFHGREHLNVSLWLNALRSAKPETILAFKYNFFGLLTDTTSIRSKHFLAAFDFQNEAELDSQKSILQEGLQLFEQLFGYKSESFIAPNYIWSNQLDKTLKDSGVKYVQTQRFQLEPTTTKFYKNSFRYTGQKSKNGLLYLVRNCYFEPSENPKIDWVQSCLKEIELSFKMKKPAIISSHRVNFISRINKENRDKNLESFSKLIKEILKKWPDVEFLSTTELGNIIEKK